jgi:hypothetical protein
MKSYLRTAIAKSLASAAPTSRNASLWLFSVLAWPLAVSAQQNALKACNLLTPPELQAAVGGSVSHPSGEARPYHKNPVVDHDGVLYTCSEVAGTRHITIHYNASPVTAQGKKFAETGARNAEEELRNQGYQIQNKDVNGSRCTTLLPPANSKATVVDESMLGTACVREKGPYVVSITVSATSQSDLLPMEKVASLVEKAVSRVPTQ